MPGCEAVRRHPSISVIRVVGVVSALCGGCGQHNAEVDSDAAISGGDFERSAVAEPRDDQGFDLVEDASVRRVVSAQRADANHLEEEEDAGTQDATARAQLGAAAPTKEAEPCVAFEMPEDCTNPQGRPLPSELRCTGLYGDWETRSAACGVDEYAPAYELWSDGAKKRRWVSVPKGQSIDASRPEAFAYPVGTQFWKEFRILVDGELRPAETRLMRKSDKGWLYTSYVWDDKGERALQTNDGVDGLFGSDHVVPTLEQCRQCHAGREDFILGWDPIMLGPGASGASYEQLIARGVLQNAAGAAPRVPGLDHEVLALGYLHANCGISCHNPAGDAKDSGLFMRLDADKLQDLFSTPAMATGLYKTPWENAKIQTLQPPQDMPFSDIYLGRPDASLVLVRMQTRGTEAQMPPVGTRHVDEQGVAWVRALIE